MAPFCQDEWTAAIVFSWKRRDRLVTAVRRAAGVPTSYFLTDEECRSMIQLTANLKPTIRQKTDWNTPIVGWLASAARFASDAMWDGDFARAIALITQGGPARRCLSRTNEYHRERYFNLCTKFIKVRETDKHHDWKTVK